MRLKVLLSLDGKTWTELYQHNGSKFLGQPDGKPLAVPAAGAKARLVRVQLPGKQYFHLDEVEVYRVGSRQNVALHKPADQSSVSQWSTAKIASGKRRAESGKRIGCRWRHGCGADVSRGNGGRARLKLAEDLRRLGAKSSPRSARCGR